MTASADQLADRARPVPRRTPWPPVLDSDGPGAPARGAPRNAPRPPARSPAPAGGYGLPGGHQPGRGGGQLISGGDRRRRSAVTDSQALLAHSRSGRHLVRSAKRETEPPTVAGRRGTASARRRALGLSSRPPGGCVALRPSNERASRVDQVAHRCSLAPQRVRPVPPCPDPTCWIGLGRAGWEGRDVDPDQGSGTGRVEPGASDCTHAGPRSAGPRSAGPRSAGPRSGLRRAGSRRPHRCRPRHASTTSSVDFMSRIRSSAAARPPLLVRGRPGDLVLRQAQPDRVGRAAPGRAGPGIGRASAGHRPARRCTPWANAPAGSSASLASADWSPLPIEASWSRHLDRAGPEDGPAQQERLALDETSRLDDRNCLGVN